MTLRQTIQAASEKAAALFTKLSETSNQAVKTRESLYAELSDELARYVDIEEQHLLPLLHKHPETKDLAAVALKGNKELRASLGKLSGLPKDNDAFLAALAEVNKGFQQHVRNERKELLPAVLKVLSDDEAATVAANIEGTIEDAETAKRDEKREERAQAKRDAEKAEQAEADKRAAAADAEKAKRAVEQAQKEAERVTREATEKVADVMERGAAAVQNRAREVTEALTERAQQVASDTQEAMTIYSDSAQKMASDMQTLTISSTASVQALSDIASVWSDWFGKAARANAEFSQRLVRSRTLKGVAESQREFATTLLHNWMEHRTAMLEITQRSSERALSARERRASETA
ncbi:hemerythrin domain-containing protein [Paracoccus benzoatiresistens]|uniref:Hemerythrin domain-containing protein n=1 Tax=Paracoccus benzoatiresistens TaxID=2997341 RepID=A0ABT4JAU0_9RHOB|nr:hemerythrin domain-containing protein [Paracoccus sp. EF6]MCZ0964248.1 hemerythrin domain-containing protein [Paracoccus sp. EF6]